MNSASIPKNLLLVSVLCPACKPAADENKPACDPEELRATTTLIAQLPPSERGRAAWDRLKSACAQLPGAFVVHYDAEEPRELSRLQNPAKENRELDPLIRDACRDFDTLRAVTRDAPPDQRAVASFDACEAERYEVIAQEQVNGFTTTEVSWALHEWLLDNGVEAELAKPITLGILAYELELGSPVRVVSGLSLPTAVGSPLADGVAVYVSPQEIRVNGESVGLRSSQLAAALTAANVLLAADVKTPFATMLDLLDVAGEAGRSSVELVVTSPDRGIGLLTLKTPPRPEAGYFPAMTVELGSEGGASARSSADKPWEWVPIARDDPAAILSFAKTVKEKLRGAETVIISASPELPLQQAVDVIAAVRGSTCEFDPCVLPFALLSRTPAHQHHILEDVWGGLTGAEVGELYGVGGLGLVGKSEAGGKSADVSAKVVQGKAEVTGKLDGDIIRRIVRAHINEVKSCHEQGLGKDPALKGRVEINFVISGQGRVASAVVQESTLDDSSVANCIAKAVKRWTFPKPAGGGNVIVNYPFELSPG